MSDTKFTPGPWERYGVDGSVDIDIVTNPGSTDATSVCRVHWNGYDHDANANLIAAAPDLYAALKGLLDAYTQSDESYCDCSEDYGEAFPCCVCIGRAALANARREVQS